MSTFNIQFEGSALPDGFQGNYKQLFELFIQHLTGSVTGDFLGGTVGGIPPAGSTDPVFNNVDFNVQIYDAAAGRYRIAGGPPIGSVFATLSMQATPPVNYLFCDGALLLKAQYPDLSEILGNQFDKPGTTGDGPTVLTHFRLPDLRGRLIVCAGSGAADPKAGTPFVLRNRLLGKYFNTTYPANLALHTNPPPERARFKADVLKIGDTVEMIDFLPPSVALNYIIRADPQPVTP